MKKNYYEALGFVESEKPFEAIPIERVKYNYRRMSSAYHPDKDTGDTARFQEIEEAWRVLSDPAKRAEYDATGTVNSAPPPPDDLLQFLASALIKALDVYEDKLEYTDIVAVLRKDFEEQRRNGFVALTSVEKKIAKRQDAAKRCKGEILPGLIAADLKKQELIGEAVRNAIAMLSRAIDMLDSHSFDHMALIQNSLRAEPDFESIYRPWGGMKPTGA